MIRLIRTTGTVQEVVDNRTYKICLEDGTEVVATISSKGKLYLKYEIYEGEEGVPIELSPNDLTRGRINPRGWKRQPSK